MRDWGEPNAMSNATESGAAESVPNSQRWIFAEDYLSSTPSIRDGIPPEKELKYRQQAARCIITMGERLNSNVASGKMSQLCFYAAMMHMHRFFVFHSFRRFDYTDVAAACLFLAGKSEECPRKLEHIVRVWWGLKFPKHPYIDKNHRHYPEASQLIVFLENVVLQTIAFDLQIEVPHTIILHSMQHVRVDKRYIETMYFFATDLPCVTNFGVRYTASALACLCIQIVCLWAQYEIPSQDNQPWYLKIDPKMTEEKLQKMQDEFLDVYASVKDTHVLSFHRFAEKNGMDFRGRPRPVKQETPTSLGIPPPPAPPTMPGSSKKVELSEYKVRKHADARSNAPSTLPAPADRIPKRSFIPDTSQLKNATTELVLPPNVAALSNSMAKPTEQSGVPRPRDDDVRRRMAEKDRERGARHSDPAGIRKRSRERDASPHHVHHADNKRIRTEGLPSSSQPRPTHVQHNFAHIPHSHTKPHSGSNGSNNHVQRLPIHSTAAVNMMRAPSDILTPPRHPSSIRGSQLKAMSPVLPPPPRPPVKQELEDGEVE